MIAIVGGGLTGLALAYELRRLGAEYLVLEASDRVGGVIRSERVQGRLVEYGPQRARLTDQLARLAGELHLGREMITASAGLPLFVFADGRLRRVPLSVADLLRSDLLSPAARLRLLLEPLTAAPRDDERVSELLTRKMGAQAYRRLLGPLYGGLYASDPADMVVGLSLGATLRELRVARSLLLPLLRRGGGIVPPPAVSFTEGLEALPRALHAAQPDRVRLGARVTAIRREGNGFRVRMGSDHLHAERVVLTVEAAQAAALLREAAPDEAERISGLRYNPLAIVHLLAEDTPEGLGYQVAFGEEMLTRGVTFNHWMFRGEGVHTAFLGGSRGARVPGMSDDAVAGTAIEELRRVTGVSASVLSVARARMPAWDVTWRAVHELSLPAGIFVAANWLARPGIPGRLGQARRVARELAAASDRTGTP
jgi:oxygen-dependent protoporphyrinogen oxidase